EYEAAVNTIAQGMSDRFDVPVVTCLRAFLSCTQGCGCGVHPAFPAPSVFSGVIALQDSGESRRGDADARHCEEPTGPREARPDDRLRDEAIHASASDEMDCFASLAMTTE